MHNKQVHKILSKLRLKGTYKLTNSYKNADLLMLLDLEDPRNNSYTINMKLKRKYLVIYQIPLSYII